MGDDTYTVQLLATKSSIVAILFRLLPLARAETVDFETPRRGALSAGLVISGAFKKELEDRGTG